MAVNAKLGVDLSSFEQGIRTGQNILKGLNAEMKNVDAEFKATGNSEQMLANKTRTLNSQLQAQKGIADQAKQALKAMDDAGVQPTDAAYQKLYATMMNAQAGMNETKAALNNLTASEQQAAAGANQLTNSVNRIGKKISLDQVITGIDKITGGLENAAKKALDLGEVLMNTILDSARRADDTATMAQMYGIDLDTFQRMQKLVANGMDTSVEAILGAQDKLKRGIGSGNKQVMEYMQELGLLFDTGKGTPTLISSDQTELFWQAGRALMAMSDAYDKEAAATALFGKSWKELIPLFSTYETLEEYNAALAEQTVNDEQTIRDLAALNDAVGKLESSWETLKDEFVGALAPALTKGADAISGLLDNLTKFLETEEGQKLLEDLGTAVSGLFEDIGKIDPKQVVENFTSVFTGLVDGLKWIVENKETLKNALIGVVAAWGAMEIGGSILTLVKLIDGLKSLGIIGGGAGATGTAGAAAGSAASTAGTAAAGTSVASIAAGALPVAAIAAAVDGIISDQLKMADWRENQKAAGYDYVTKYAKYYGNDMFNIWDTLTRYSFATGTGAEDQDKLIEFAHHYVSWMNDTVADPMLDALTEQMSQEGFDNFDDIMTRIVNGEHFYSNEDLAALSKAIDDAIKAAEEIMKPEVDVDVKAPDDAAAQITEQVGTVLIHGRIVAGAPYLQAYANGTPYVPQTGLALLHKGERVMTASENKHYTYNSNNYFGNVNLNNGLEIEALCDSIDRHNRKQRSGYGS